MSSQRPPRERFTVILESTAGDGGDGGGGPRKPEEPSSSASSVSIVRSVSSVGLVTLVCKMLGLIREVIIAASFGVGWVSVSRAHISLHFFFVLFIRLICKQHLVS